VSGRKIFHGLKNNQITESSREIRRLPFKQATKPVPPRFDFRRRRPQHRQTQYGRAGLTQGAGFNSLRKLRDQTILKFHFDVNSRPAELGHPVGAAVRRLKMADMLNLRRAAQDFSGIEGINGHSTNKFRRRGRRVFVETKFDDINMRPVAFLR